MDACNWTPTDHEPITWQIRRRRTNHDRELCFGYGYIQLQFSQEYTLKVVGLCLPIGKVEHKL